MPPVRRIFLLCPEWDVPAGGVRKIYRHADVLSAHGFNAYVSHHTRGFRCKWFENTTPIVYPPECFPRTFDIMCMPEIYSWDLCRQAPGVPKIIFNQNAYQTFDCSSDEAMDDPAPYMRPEVLGTIVVSEDSRKYLQYAFPGHLLFRIRYSIDPELFVYEPKKKRQIAFMPRKLAADAVQVLSILEARGVTKDVEIVKIEKKTEAETAAILRESQIFLSFAMEEGWSLPPMEAMACGCIVIGYDGRGGREYFTKQNGFPIAADDIVGFASTVESVLKETERDPLAFREMTHRASEFVRTEYSPANEEADIVRTWQQILQLPSLPPVVI